MAQVCLAFSVTPRSAEADTKTSTSGDRGLKCRLSFSPHGAEDAPQEPTVTFSIWPLESVPDDWTCDRAPEQLRSPPNPNAFLKARSGSDSASDVSSECASHSNHPNVKLFEDTENVLAHPSTVAADLHPDPGMLLQSIPDNPTSEQTQEQLLSQLDQSAMTSGSDSTGVSHECSSHSDLQRLKSSEDKEHILVQASNVTADNTQAVTPAQGRPLDSTLPAYKQHGITEDEEEVEERALEQGCVDVIFPGTVTQDGCCRFISEILKFILYQRQQLPMTYDQLVFWQKKQPPFSVLDTDTVRQRPVQSPDGSWRKCQQTLQDLEELLQQLEVVFSLSRVPRVLLLMGGSLVLPKELYEINMEALVLAGEDQSLRETSCLRQLVRTLFVADVLFDTNPVHLMATTILVLAHRDSGVDWFCPKLQFEVPTRVKKQTIALSADPSSCNGLRADETDWQDYVWFQAPTTIKGFIY